MVNAKRLNQLARKAFHLVGADGHERARIGQTIKLIAHTGPEFRVVSNMMFVIVEELGKALVEQFFARLLPCFPEAALKKQPGAATHKMTDTRFGHAFAPMQFKDHIQRFAEISRRVGQCAVEIEKQGRAHDFTVQIERCLSRMAA